ncbi:unnamed protein product [Amoebophrya sp. A120]|nr:unnamed protein product [Amoebophrya sp. A120]|eukprot:GSA120T00003659001.1
MTDPSADDQKKSRRKRPAHIETAPSDQPPATAVRPPKPPEADSPTKKYEKQRPPSPSRAKKQGEQSARSAAAVKLEKWSDCMPLLKAEAFFLENSNYLTDHPFIRDARNGKLSTNRARKLVAESFYVVRSDLRTFTVAYDLHQGRKDDTVGKFFEFSRIACQFAADHLKHFQKALKLSDEEMERYEPSPRSQCYTAYTSWLVTHTTPAMIAVCYALLYPVWAEMCKNIVAAVQANPKYRLSDHDITYFRFYAEALDDMDLLVKELMKGADTDHLKSWPYKRIKDSVRVLQTYLVEFWDGIYHGAYCA